MDAAATSAPHLIVYDSDCSICTGAVRSGVGLGLFPHASVRPYQSFDGPELARLDAAGVRNELVVLDQDTGQARAGVPALLSVTALPGWLRAVLGSPPVVWLLVLGYRTFSYNRRVFAPPPRFRPDGSAPIDCACDPDLHLGYRGLFLSAGVGATLLFTVLVGAPHVFTIAVISGWVLPVAAVCGVPRGRRADYLGHLVMTMLVGSAILLPGTLLGRLFQWNDGVQRMVLVASVVVSFAAMVTMVYRRFMRTGLGPWWVGMWLVSMLGAPLATLATLAILRALGT